MATEELDDLSRLLKVEYEITLKVKYTHVEEPDELMQALEDAFIDNLSVLNEDEWLLMDNGESYEVEGFSTAIKKTSQEYMPEGT